MSRQDFGGFVATLSFVSWPLAAIFIVGAAPHLWPLLLYPIGFVASALFIAFPAVFQPWTIEARLRRRIWQARREQELLELRAAAEAAEAATERALNTYIEGAA